MEFPALLKTPVAAAVVAIKAAHPTFSVLAVPDGSMVTMDFREDRVRVFHTPAGLVSRVPRTG